MIFRLQSKDSIIITLGFILTFALTSAFVIPAQAQSPTIYMVESNNLFPQGTPAGTLFNVTVWVADAVAIGGANIYVEFDDSIIVPTRWFEPTWSTSYIFYGETTSPYPAPSGPPEYVHDARLGCGYLQVMVSPFPPPPDQPSFNGTGIICMLEFNITKSPTPAEPMLSTTLSLTHIKTITFYSYLVDVSGNEVPGVILQSGSYGIVPEFTSIVALSLTAISTATIVLVKKKFTANSGQA